MASTLPTVPDETFVSAAFLADPYPALAELRAVAPVYFSPNVGGWMLTAYGDIVGTFRDTDRYSNEGMVMIT